MNPLKLMKLKGAWETFQTNHPQFLTFLQAVYPNGVKVGSVLDISITAPDGKPLRYRMTVSEQDMALFREMQELTKNG